MKTIKVFAPATVANLGCGFDVMGMAIDGTGDVLEISVGDGRGISIKNHSNVYLPVDPEKKCYDSCNTLTAGRIWAGC